MAPRRIGFERGSAVPSSRRDATSIPAPLLEADMAVAGNLELPDVLDLIVRSACELTGVR